jgi:acylphosphatase
MSLDEYGIAMTRDDQPVRLTVWVRGGVQAVGFRWWTRSRALELGLVGSATNLDDGRVEIIAEGDRAACERLLALLTAVPSLPTPPKAHRSWRPRPGEVLGYTAQWSPARGGLVGFVER